MSPVRFKYGVGRKWGESPVAWRWGYGTPDPGFTCGTVQRFQIEEGIVVDFVGGGPGLISIDNRGDLTVLYDAGGSLQNQVFYLQAPAVVWWQVTANGLTGALTWTDNLQGATGGLQVPSPDGRLWNFSMSDAGNLSWSDGDQTFTIEPPPATTYTVEPKC